MRNRGLRWPAALFAAATLVLSAGPLLGEGPSVLDNGEFDTGIAGWTRQGSPDPAPVHVASDHDGCSNSGAVSFTTNETDDDNWLRDCELGIEGGSAYTLHGFLRFTTGDSLDYALFAVFWLDSTDGCTGNELSTHYTESVFGNAGDAWFLSESAEIEAPVDARSAIVKVLLHSPSAGLATVLADGIHLVPASGFLFANGFELGSTCRWDDSMGAPI